MSTAPNHLPLLTGPEPAWQIATLFPPQGAWSADDYLNITDATNHLIELSDGQIEVLEMPTTGHQLVLAFLYGCLKDFVAGSQIGTVVFSALRLRLGTNLFREPDILFAHAEHREYVQPRFWTGADLVMEVVSEDDGSRHRDYVQKRAEYAAAGIPEYWIVDPRDNRITVLALDGHQYVVHGEHPRGEQAASRLLPGFAVDVTAAFDAANG